MEFRVELEVFRGPLDLLLYLVRKHEVEITDLPIAPITDQFLEYLTVLEQLDINVVGDFVEMASTLMELKSRLVLPRSEEVEDELADPRNELVRRLLEYKKFKDAASMLEERAARWQEGSARVADDLPPRSIDPAEQEIHEVELWDLVSAFGRVIRESLATQPTSVVYDDTPIHVHMDRISERLRTSGRTTFRELFERGMHKSALIGVFLAVLELVRHHRVTAEQSDLFGDIVLVPAAKFAATLESSEVESYEHGQRDAPPD